MRELQRTWRPGGPLDVRATLAPLRRGHGDPAFRITPDGALWRAVRTPSGPATVRLDPGHGGEVAARAWGAGAEWVLDRLPGLLGDDDDPGAFVPRHAVIAELARRFPGWRVPRTGLVMEALVPAALEQKVPGREAWRAWRSLLRWYGEPAPGPAPEGMRVPPAASVWQRIPSWGWHRAGVEGVRSRTILEACRVATRLEETVGLPAGEAERRLRTVPGVGVWTAAEVRQRAHGDPDAVSVGDYHVSKLVGWALVGEPVDDDRMLELLAPYAGQRYRAVRLIELSGLRPPRRGPRMPVRDYRRI